MIREALRNLDYPLILAVLFLMISGVVMIHSASASENLDIANIWEKQIVWVVFSFTAMILIIPLPSKFISAGAWTFYAAGVLALIVTQIYGARAGGSERWLIIGPIRVQPSEFMKAAAVLALARFLSRKKYRPTSYVKCLPAFAIVGIPMLLVRMQPDLGTSLVFAGIVLPMLYWAGLDTVRIFFLVAPVLSAIFTAPFIPVFNPIVWVAFMFVVLAVLYYARYSLTGMAVNLGANIFAGVATPWVFNMLNEYQQKRITTIFNPEADPLSSGYQIINSMIAVGSGGVLGKGLGEGRYTELGFLPHAHTDFIFSVIGEETGFVGALLFLLVIYYVVCRAIIIATEVKSPFMSIASVGIASVFAFHMFVNIGMVIGIMPVTGLPLPFLSYGGSSCLANAVMIGLLLNFKVHRHEF